MPCSGMTKRVRANTDVSEPPGRHAPAREVAAFDTSVPHWFGSTGEEAAEILSIFGRPGERMTVRTPPLTR
jgi:hypothetical protein